MQTKRKPKTPTKGMAMKRGAKTSATKRASAKTSATKRVARKEPGKMTMAKKTAAKKVAAKKPAAKKTARKTSMTSTTERASQAQKTPRRSMSVTKRTKTREERGAAAKSGMQPAPRRKKPEAPARSSLPREGRKAAPDPQPTADHAEVNTGSLGNDAAAPVFVEPVRGGYMQADMLAHSKPEVQLMRRHETLLRGPDRRPTVRGH